MVFPQAGRCRAVPSDMGMTLMAAQPLGKHNSLSVSSLEQMDDLAEDIFRILQEEVSKVVNDEIIEKMFLAQGWHRAAYQGEQTVAEVGEWCATHCQMRYRVFYDRAVFESLDDATLFKLTWG